MEKTLICNSKPIKTYTSVADKIKQLQNKTIYHEYDEKHTTIPPKIPNLPNTYPTYDIKYNLMYGYIGCSLSKFK
jgi:hypothetical protein